MNAQFFIVVGNNVHSMLQLCVYQSRVKSCMCVLEAAVQLEHIQIVVLRLHACGWGGHAITNPALGWITFEK